MPDKVALITGGARRVGAAISRLLHDGGMNLMVHYRTSAEQARALQAELNALRPDPAPSSSSSPPVTPSISAACRASAALKREVSSGAVTKSPEAPSLLLPPV